MAKSIEVPTFNTNIFQDIPKYDAMIDTANDSVSLARIRDSLHELRLKINNELTKANAILTETGKARPIRATIVQQKNHIESHLRLTKATLHKCEQKRDEIRRSERPAKLAQQTAQCATPEIKELLYKSYLAMDAIYNRGISFTKQEKSNLDKLRQFVTAM